MPVTLASNMSFPKFNLPIFSTRIKSVRFVLPGRLIFKLVCKTRYNTPTEAYTDSNQEPFEFWYRDIEPNKNNNLYTDPI
jgi:hypothetical protein